MSVSMKIKPRQATREQAEAAIKELDKELQTTSDPSRRKRLRKKIRSYKQPHRIPLKRQSRQNLKRTLSEILEDTLS